MRVKIVEIFKFIVSVAIGFTLRIMLENSYKVPKADKNCVTSKDVDSDLLLDNIHEQLRQPYSPKSLRDVIEFRYFNLSMVFDTHLGQIETKMKPYHSSDIRDILQQVKSHINHGQADKFKIESLLNGFERIDPIRGKEYIMDLELVLEKHRKLNTPKRVYRINLVKPFSYAQIVSQNDVTVTKARTINVLYTCSDQNIPHIEYLLKYHESNIIHFLPVNVTIYVCSMGKSNEKLNAMVDNFTKKHEKVKSYKLHLVFEPGCVFKVPSSVNKAIKLLGNTDSRLVILGVNVNVTYHFLQRCYSILSDNVIYVPIPFVEFLHRDPNYDNQLNEESGIWDHGNQEILCIHQKVFVKSNGLPEDETSDKSHVSFLNKLIRLQKEVFRSTDPSVRLSYHQLDCVTQNKLYYSSREYCEFRQNRTFQSLKKYYSLIKLP